MNLTSWYKKRGLSFILGRARRLNERYGIGPRKAMARIESCVAAIRTFDCFPTFAVPGMVVERNREFILRLQELGAEIAVHGYNHVDLQACPPEEGSRQLQRAAAVFREHGLEVHGFRCPYLSASDALLKAIPAGAFEYSSNRAIQWPVGQAAGQPDQLMFETIRGFYAPEPAENTLSLPWFQDGLVEIPVCVPDDLQMHDGLGFGLGQIGRAWLDILHETHRRGEIFNLMFHPELASFCEAPFELVLEEARSLTPWVWLARLHEVSAWWQEKAGFWAAVEQAGERLAVRLHCTPRATILARGFEPLGQGSRWDETYWRLDAHRVVLDDTVLPFVGLPNGAPEWAAAALRSMGYLVETGEAASECSLVLDAAALGRLSTPRALIDHVEGSPGRLVRFWPWPDGARSALCITGDLDALSLADYANRLLKR